MYTTLLQQQVRAPPAPAATPAAAAPAQAFAPAPAAAPVPGEPFLAPVPAAAAVPEETAPEKQCQQLAQLSGTPAGEHSKTVPTPPGADATEKQGRHLGEAANITPSRPSAAQPEQVPQPSPQRQQQHSSGQGGPARARPTAQQLRTALLSRHRGGGIPPARVPRRAVGAQGAHLPPREFAAAQCGGRLCGCIPRPRQPGSGHGGGSSSSTTSTTTTTSSSFAGGHTPSATHRCHGSAAAQQHEQRRRWSIRCGHSPLPGSGGSYWCQCGPRWSCAGGACSRQRSTHLHRHARRCGGSWPCGHPSQGKLASTCTSACAPCSQPQSSRPVSSQT